MRFEQKTEDLGGRNAYFNSGSVVHRITCIHRNETDGTVSIINYTECGQMSPGMYAQRLRLTNSEVTCKKCLKLLSEEV